MHSERGYPFDPQPMRRRGRAENGDVGLRCLQTLAVVRKDVLRRNGQRTRNSRHARRLFITNADNFGVWVFLHLAQQITHMHMIKVNPNELEFTHLPSLLCPLTAVFCPLTSTHAPTADGTGGTY